MLKLTHQWDGQTLTIALTGRIGMDEAPSAEEQLQSVRQQYAAASIVLDCAKLEYATSAGLRVIMRLWQDVQDLRLVNVSPAFYEVLEMTGFTEIMPVEKAFREVSVEGCEVIGEGANGKVYRIQGDAIVKVYQNPDALPEIRLEREKARAAFILGLPTAISYDVVRIRGGGYGTVFELIDAYTYCALLRSGEKKPEELAALSIDLLKLIHSKTIQEDFIPDVRLTVLKWVDNASPALPPEASGRLRELILSVPDDMHLIHGDYHIKNIMFQKGESLLIDLDTLSHGHPVFELANMYNAYAGYGETDPALITNFLGLPMQTATAFWQQSLRLYLDGADEDTIRAVEEMAMLLGHTHILSHYLRRNTKSEKDTVIIRHSAERIMALLKRIDTLTW